MKAAIAHRLGGTPTYGEFPKPTAAEGEEVVEVIASSIKQLDRAIVSGLHYASPRNLPFVPGTDGVAHTRRGPSYFAANRPPFGAMAEFALASWTVPLPTALDEAVAAAIVNPALGAWLPLSWRGKLRLGENVLVLGATGATGRLAVTAARLLGAGRVVAAGRRADVLATLDADATIDLKLPTAELRAAFESEAARGLGLVIDYVWGAPAQLLIEVLVRPDLESSGNQDDTRLVSVGAMAAPEIALPSAALRGSRLTILGSGTANFPRPDRMAALVGEILDHARSGAICLATREAPLSAVEKLWGDDGQDARIVLRPR